MFAIYGSILMADVESGRSSADRACESCLSLASPWLVPARCNATADRGHGHLSAAGSSLRAEGANARRAVGSGGIEGSIHCQVAPEFSRPIASLRRIDRANTQPHRQSGPLGAVPARGPWLSGGRQPIECSWSIVLIACNGRNSGRPTSYSCPNDGARFRTNGQR